MDKNLKLLDETERYKAENEELLGRNEKLIAEQLEKKNFLGGKKEEMLIDENRQLKTALNSQKSKFQSIAKDFDNCRLQFEMCQSSFNQQIEYFHSDGENENICVICQQEFLANSKRTKLTCGHN